MVISISWFKHLMWYPSKQSREEAEMNYKKLLAYSLAATCVLNTPTALLAAEQQTSYQTADQQTETKKLSVITDLPKQLEADALTTEQQEQLKALTQLAKTDTLAVTKQLNQVLEENAENASFSEKAIRSVLDVWFGQEPFDENAVQILQSQCTNDMVYAKIKDYYAAQKEREDVYLINDMDCPGKKLPAYDEKHIRVYFKSDIGEEVIGKLADYLCASYEKAERWDPLEEGSNLSVMQVALRLDQTTNQAIDLFKQYIEIESAGICSYTYPAGGINTPSDSIIQTEEQTNDQSHIDRIQIEPNVIVKNHSTYKRLTCGSSMGFLIKVYKKDGSIATGEEAKVKCELRSKDGSPVNAEVTLTDPKVSIPQDDIADSGYAKINIYAPYGYEENLELVVYSAQNEAVKQTHSFQTVLDKRDGVALSKFDLGTTAGKVNVSAAKESWNAEKQNYTITLPKVTAKKKEDQFVGWKDGKGKIYAAGKDVTVSSHSIQQFEAVWKTKTGTNFSIRVDEKLPYRVQYAVTGKNKVAFIKSTCFAKTSYSVKIPDIVEFHNETYKVDSVAASAFKLTGVKKLVIGKNVTKLDRNAFGKNNIVKSIIIRSEQIKSVGKNALKEIPKDAVIQCPKAKVKAYTKLFRKAGLNKKVIIKGV